MRPLSDRSKSFHDLANFLTTPIAVEGLPLALPARPQRWVEFLCASPRGRDRLS